MIIKNFLICLLISASVLVPYYSYNKYNVREISSINLTNEDILNLNSSDTDLDIPSIDKVYPSKCQQYIVGRPLIEATYSDKSGIDISSIKLYVNYVDVTNKCTITESKISYTPEKKFVRGNQIVKLVLSDSSVNKNKNELEWYFTVGTPIYNHYYGLLHSHTSATDGHGTYDDAYYMARDKSNLDFFAVTEHSNMLDHNEISNINDATNSKEWNDLISSRDKFTYKDKFIALHGFEMTYPYNVIDPIGHINIFNSSGFITANKPEMTLDNFYKILSEDENLIGQFNHPCDKFGKFNDFKYNLLADKVMCLLEVGNGYNKDMEKNIHSYDMYQIALDKGWHVAPTCSQDNHIVDFGIANQFRTVILATDLNRENLYDSLKNMRVYATEDKNIKIDYTINDLPMGSQLKNPSKLRFSISVVDNDEDDKIKNIQVIGNKGQIINDKEFNSNLAKLDFSINAKKNNFYYVKVIQSNNKISVTAPIWIK